MTVAHNVGSHAGGYGTETACDYQTVIGKFNTLDSTKSFIIGGGSQNQTTNIFTVDWEGNVEAANFKGTADRVQNSLQINGKTYDGSSAISVGTIEVAYGGTGYSSIKDTTYTTARYRASALYSSETTPTTNGVINWTYE